MGSEHLQHDVREVADDTPHAGRRREDDHRQAARDKADLALTQEERLVGQQEH